MGENVRPTGQKVRETQTAGAMSAPLGLPTAPPLAVWEELAEEAQRYLELLSAWKDADPTERTVLDGKLVSSLSHLRVHSQVMDDALEEAMMLADDLDEHEFTSRR